MFEMLKVEVNDDKVILDREEFEDFMENLELTMETLEILADRDMMEQIAEGEEDIRNGRVYSVKNRKELEKLLGI